MVPHWAFWSSFYWGASSGQETIAGVVSFMVHDMVGQHTGIQQGQIGSPGVDTWTPHLWNFESAYSKKQLPPRWHRPWPPTWFCHLSIVVWEVRALPWCDLGLGSHLAAAAV